MDNLPRPLLRAETARMKLGSIPRSSFNKALREGKIPGVQIGSRWYVRASWLEQVLGMSA